MEEVTQCCGGHSGVRLKDSCSLSALMAVVVDHRKCVLSESAAGQECYSFLCNQSTLALDHF